mmetsp:Transcript_17496/g.31588  ORF Transcript_17496/g.31588 Transcript_17496/m.31588 type:complete len:586 (+) Transcript_17496:10133-11890(+)
MPTVTLKRANFLEALGLPLTDFEFDELCFEFGIELDDVTSEAEIARRERGTSAAEGLSTEVLYKIDIPANRYDLLSQEGLVQALRVFKNLSPAPAYNLVVPEHPEQIVVDASTAEFRPFVVGAILRNIKFTPDTLRSFLDLQDRLHQNICRKRTLVAIGTHDYDTIKGPILYTAKPPQEIVFKALNQENESNAEALFEVLSNDNKLKNYLSIISSYPRYPVIYDSQGIVLSLPPIINGDHSKLTVDTRNVFIECTATDLTKAHIVLKTLVAAFSEYTENKYDIEAVHVVDSRGNSHVTPRFENTQIDVEVEYVNKLVGVHLNVTEISTLLNRMCLTNSVTSASALRVQVPITRPDVLHSCDIAEDVAIAFGYNNIVRRIPALNTTASEQPLNVYADMLRDEIARAGFTEVLTFILVAFKENYEDLLRPRDGLAVEIANPSSQDFQLPRTTLIPGLLKTLSANKTHPKPIKIFELGDCVVKDSAHPSGCKNIRKLSALQANTTAELEVIHGLLDIVLGKLGFKFSRDYFLRPSDHPTFLPGRQAEIVLKDHVIGHLGIIHPEVLENFDLKLPVSLFEVDVEALNSL